MLDVLRGRGRATFFVLGDRVRAHAELVGRTLAEGHAVELHAHEHLDHTGLDASAIAEDTDRALRTLGSVGVRPRLWRTPWGRTTEASAAVARRRGLSLVHWDHDTQDWDGRAAAGMLPRLRRSCSDGGVVLCHDGLGPGARRRDVRQTVLLLDSALTWAHHSGLAVEALAGTARPGTSGR